MRFIELLQRIPRLFYIAMDFYSSFWFFIGNSSTVIVFAETGNRIPYGRLNKPKLFSFDSFSRPDNLKSFEHSGNGGVLTTFEAEFKRFQSLSRSTKLEDLVLYYCIFLIILDTNWIKKYILKNCNMYCSLTILIIMIIKSHRFNSCIEKFVKQEGRRTILSCLSS